MLGRMRTGEVYVYLVHVQDLFTGRWSLKQVDICGSV